MKRRSRAPKDLRLKIAIIESRRTQRWLAVETRIGESRMSEIVGRRGTPPSDDEQARIAKNLNREIAELFDVEPLDDQGQAPAALSDDAKRAS